MPRKHPLTRAERDIGERLLQARKQKRCSRVHLAHSAGVHASVIKRVELGRAVLRGGLAIKICDLLGISFAWLAEGLGSPTPKIPIADELKAQIPVEIPFSKAFSELLKPRLGTLHKLVMEGRAPGFQIELLDPLGLPAEDLHEWHLIADLKKLFRRIPPELRPRLARKIRECTQTISIDGKSEEQVKQLLELEAVKYRMAPWKESEKIDIDETSTFRNTTADMKLARTMKELLGDVEKLTEPVGAKARLAEYLKVPQSRVSEWLAGKHKPSGELTLKLARWVNDPKERKQ